MLQAEGEDPGQPGQQKRPHLKKRKTIMLKTSIQGAGEMAER